MFGEIAPVEFGLALLLACLGIGALMNWQRHRSSDVPRPAARPVRKSGR